MATTFNDRQLNVIEVTWGDKGIYDYKRALLRSSVPLEGKTKSLDVLKVFVLHSQIIIRLISKR